LCPISEEYSIAEKKIQLFSSFFYGYCKTLYVHFDFEQIVDDRYRKKALIVSSQLPAKDWYAVIGNELIAEAYLDRIVHKAIRFQLKGESLRKKY
jgi:DNA replication protein DnaC